MGNNRINTIVAKLGDFVSLIVHGDLLLKGGALRSPQATDLRLEAGTGGKVKLGEAVMQGPVALAGAATAAGALTVNGVLTTNGALAANGACVAGVNDLRYAVTQTAGQRGVGWVNWSGDGADGETVTIGTTVYELDTDGSVTPGNVPVDISGGVGKVACATALVAAVNANPDSSVVAADSFSGSALLCTKSTAADTGLATSCANATVSGIRTVQRSVPRPCTVAFGTYVVTAKDEAVLTPAFGIIIIGSPVPPAGVGEGTLFITARDGSGGLVSLPNTRAALLFVGGVFIVGLADTGAGTHDLDTGDLVSWMAIL